MKIKDILLKVLIIPVNFNSYKELFRYLTSIDKAAKKSANTIVDVIIADNSTLKETCNFEFPNIHSIHIESYNNLGYLGGAQEVINSLPYIKEYDYVAISNVDIVLDEDFFVQLEQIKIPEKVAWVATKIDSLDEHRDRNPKVLNRYSKKKLSLLYLMYKYPILYYLYTNTVYNRKKLAPSYPQMEIYAGHGSFMMLTKTFFKVHPKIDYPVFLFGEELFLAEEVMKVGMKVLYVPSLRVIDNEHVSTSTLKKKSYFKFNQNSIKYILNHYYE